MHRVLLTGSRRWSDAELIFRELDRLVRQHGVITLIHGDCSRGADAIADRWARNWPGVLVERYPANWREFGKAAGPIRNLEMVNAGPDECLAFILDHSKGASQCASAAMRAGVPTRVFLGWGVIEKVPDQAPVVSTLNPTR